MDILSYWFSGIRAFIDDGFAWNEYLLLLIISILYLSHYWKKDSRYILVYNPIILFVILLNPVSTYITSKFFPLDAYYGRLVNIIPIVYIIACGAVCFVEECAEHKKIKKNIFYVVIILVFALAGESMYYNHEYESRLVTTENHMHLPQYVVDAANVMLASADEGEDVKAAVPWDYTLYIRQFSADVKLGWGRYDWLEDEVITNNYGLTEIDIPKLVKHIKKQGCNYIVFPRINDGIVNQFVENGCIYITTDGNNDDIYKLNL